jgi:hypothetical protein
MPLQSDVEIYKWRHLIKSFFCELKEFKRIAMRSDKKDSSFAAVITLASAVINHVKSQNASYRTNKNARLSAGISAASSGLACDVW